jgi:ATP-dependent Clp protease ATP-binding subunit ClpC
MRPAVMFERFTQKALSTIFSARRNTILLGSAQIEPEHLLLGLLHESTLGDVSWTLLVRHKEWLSKQIYARAPMNTQSSVSVETPFSREAKRVLVSAIEEAERLSDKRVGAEHLLLGLLREQDCFTTELLNECGILLERTRTAIASLPRDQEEQQRNPASSPPGV